MDIVVDLDSVSKSYRLGASQTSLREAIASSARNLFSSKRQKSGAELFWALKNVSYQVERGEVVGIIGHNGAGKSTMLKLLSRVTHPTEGRIRTRGRMASLIELGAGFHPDLSGRENIYLNGSILGLKRSEIDAQMESIVSFASLEKFVDTPVKRYSSGMYVRLAFAVASHVKADLLLVDEVLSVGDLGFQDKSLKKMKELRDNGATIVFISHNMNAVNSFCQRVLLMDHGRLVGNGAPAQIIRQFEDLQRQVMVREQREKAAKLMDGALADVPEASTSSTFRPKITDVQIINDYDANTSELNDHEGMRVRWQTNVPGTVFKPVYGVRVCRASDGFTCYALWESDRSVIQLHGTAETEVYIPRHGLVAGEYYLEVSINDGGSKETLAYSPHIPLVVTGLHAAENEGIYRPVAEWRFETPETAG
jgi:lipopolysaccharide transport system ATP-binding protein